MPAATEYFQFGVVEERIGKRALTAYKLRALTPRAHSPAPRPI